VLTEAAMAEAQRAFDLGVEEFLLKQKEVKTRWKWFSLC
jgi:hypothetical protein